MITSNRPSSLAKEFAEVIGWAQASKESLAWYKSIKDGRSRDADKWDNKFMEAGKIYIFNYTPKTADVLSFYDKHPMVLSLGVSQTMGLEGPLDLGINLNFIPPKERIQFLDMIYKFNYFHIEREIRGPYANEPWRQRKLTNITPALVGRYLKDRGYPFAVRSYYRGRRKNVVVMNYSEWYKLVFLESQVLIGTTIEQLRFLYFQHNKKMLK